MQKIAHNEPFTQLRTHCLLQNLQMKLRDNWLIREKKQRSNQYCNKSYRFILSHWIDNRLYDNQKWLKIVEVLLKIPNTFLLISKCGTLARQNTIVTISTIPFSRFLPLQGFFALFLFREIFAAAQKIDIVYATIDRYRNCWLQSTSFNRAIEEIRLNILFWREENLKKFAFKKNIQIWIEWVLCRLFCRWY